MAGVTIFDTFDPDDPPTVDGDKPAPKVPQELTDELAAVMEQTRARLAHHHQAQ